MSTPEQPVRCEPVDLTVSLIGPTQAGKTGVVGSLTKACKEENVFKDNLELQSMDYREKLLDDLAQLSLYSPPRCEVRPLPEDEGDPKQRISGRGRRGMALIRDHVRDQVMRGLSLNPNLVINKAIFDLRVQSHTVEQHASFGDWVPVRIQVFDGPGEDVLPGRNTGEKRIQEDGETGKSLIELAADSDAMILCADPRKPDNVQWAIDGTLGRIIQDRPALPFRRVVILLTHCDLLFFEKGHDAKKRVDNADAVQGAREALGNTGCRALQGMLAKDAEICCGYSSLFGFLTTGEPNFNENKERLRKVELKTWKPYGVVDPWRFIVTGHPGRMKRIRPEELVQPA